MSGLGSLSVGDLRGYSWGLGAKDIMVGDAHDYEPWFRDGEIEVCGHLPTLSRPGMNMIHEMLVRLGYIVDGFGQYGGRGNSPLQT